ncbi:hypothetical protein EYC59_03835 [Candidatus Saccharibacteria bacterium]|nr:MAG: hypothetical protein EYC59_03835 [Candidatus Saccharibacteria bacterium]
MAHSTATGTAPEQQIPNYTERAAAVETRVRDLFASSLAAGSLAVLGSGIVTSSKSTCFDSGSDHVYFEIGVPLGEPSDDDRGVLFRHYWSRHSLDDGGLLGDMAAAYYWPDTFRVNQHRLQSRWGAPTFPVEHDPNDLVRGKRWPRFHPLNSFQEKGVIYIATPGDDDLWERKIGWVRDEKERGLYIDGNDIFNPHIGEVSRNLGKMEELLGITVSAAEVER